MKHWNMRKQNMKKNITSFILCKHFPFRYRLILSKIWIFRVFIWLSETFVDFRLNSSGFVCFRKMLRLQNDTEGTHRTLCAYYAYLTLLMPPFVAFFLFFPSLFQMALFSKALNLIVFEKCGAREKIGVDSIGHFSVSWHFSFDVIF